MVTIGLAENCITGDKIYTNSKHQKSRYLLNANKMLFRNMVVTSGFTWSFVFVCTSPSEQFHGGVTRNAEFIGEFTLFRCVNLKMYQKFKLYVAVQCLR